MSHPASETSLSPAEREFMDLMQHGDDFLKIELLRPAKSWYQKALKLNIETGKVEQKIIQCDEMLAFEIKVIRILTAIAALLVIVYFIFK
jgi:hypothetical protein